MKKHFLAGALALSMAPAFAADMATKAPLAMPAARPIYDWTGFYIGINGGWAQSHNCWDMNGALVFGFNPAKPEGCNSANGAVVGGQVGARYQINNFVFGIEAQGDWADLKGSNQSAIFNGINAKIAPAAISLTNTSKIDAIGMFTGQIGYSFGPALWYVKGGAAVTNNEYDGSLNRAGTTVLTATDHAAAVRFGEVVGTGLDFMFAPNWFVGIEYDHLFMGSHKTGFALTGSNPATPIPPLLAPGMPTRNDSISGDIDMVTAKIGYKF